MVNQTNFVGQPCSVDKGKFIYIISQFRNEIIENSRIVSKNKNVWKKLSDYVGNRLSAQSIYSMVVSNRYSFKNKLFPELDDPIREISPSNSLNRSSRSLNSETNSLESMDSSDDTTMKSFNIYISKEEFSTIVEEKHRRCTGLKNNGESLYYRCFKSGVWQNFMQLKIASVLKGSCGFYFEGHYVNKYENKGNFKGKNY